MRPKLFQSGRIEDMLRSAARARTGELEDEDARTTAIVAKGGWGCSDGNAQPLHLRNAALGIAAEGLRAGDISGRAPICDVLQPTSELEG